MNLMNALEHRFIRAAIFLCLASFVPLLGSKLLAVPPVKFAPVLNSSVFYFANAAGVAVGDFNGMGNQIWRH